MESWSISVDRGFISTFQNDVGTEACLSAGTKSEEDILPEHRTCSLLCIENWEWAYNKLRDTIEKNAAPLPESVQRDLGHKLCRRRKVAALEVENIVNSLAEANDDHKITEIIVRLTNDFAVSPLVNRLKGGLIALAAVGVGLAPNAALAPYLQDIVPRIINSSTDDDGRVRYYSCIALSNIAKEWGEEIITFFKTIFEALWKLSTDVDPAVQHDADVLDSLLQDIVKHSDRFRFGHIIPLLTERMNAQHPNERQFLLRWITVLGAVPKDGSLGFLPNFLDGLFEMLCDGNQESRNQTSKSVEFGRRAVLSLIQGARSSDAFTRSDAITWIKDFLKLGGDQLVPYYADVLGVVLPCISDSLEIIQEVARETNGQLQSVMAEPSKDFDVGAVLVIARREFLNGHEATELEALRWIILLLQSHREKVLASVPDDISSALSASSSNPSAEIVQLVMEILTLVKGEV